MNKLPILLIILFMSCTCFAAEFHEDAKVRINEKISFNLLSESGNEIVKGIPAEKKETVKGNKSIHENTYKDIIENIDLKYTEENNRIKEEIVLKKKPNIDKLSFNLSIDGDYEIVDDNIYVYHSRNIHVVDYIIEAPYYFLNSEKKYIPFDYENGIFELDISELLKLKNLDFPLAIDPTVTDVSSGCSENATHYNCSGTITGSYINTDKIIVFNGVSWSYGGSCGNYALKINTTKDLFLYGTSISVSCSGCGSACDCYGTSISIYANNSYIYGSSTSSGGCCGHPGWSCGAAGGSINWYVDNYGYFNKYSTGLSGDAGASDSCSYSGYSTSLTIYSNKVSFTNESSLNSAGSGTDGTAYAGGSGNINILRVGNFENSFVNISNSSSFTSTGAAGLYCSSGSGNLRVGDSSSGRFEKIISDSGVFNTGTINPNPYFYAGNEIIFFNRTTLPAVPNSQTARVLLNETNAKIALFDPRITGSYKINISSNDNNLTVGILESNDATENVTISGTYHTVNYPSFFNPDYQNITVVPKTVNYTSEGSQPCGYNGSTYSLCYADYEQPLIEFRTYNPALCKLWNESKNWSTLSTMQIPDCAYEDSITYVEGGRKQTCLFSQPLYDGLNNLYISCKSYDIQINSFNQSNIFNITIDKRETAKNAIEEGINISLGSEEFLIKNNPLIYIRLKNNTQRYGVFDKYLLYQSQRYAFNYVSLNDSSVGVFYNLSGGFYFLELQNKTTSTIRSMVSGLINQTK